MSKIVANIENYLPGFEVAGLAVADSVLGKYHLAEMAREVRANVEGGSEPRAALLDSIAGWMEAQTAARRRQIVENLAGKVSAVELKNVTNEFDRAAASADFRLEAERFINSSSNPAQSANTPIAADEDLRGHS